MPKHFSDVYPDLRATLDCTEVFCSSLETAVHSMSNYKKQCTIKYLLSDRTITFVSKGYGGRAGDRFIVSGILDKFDTGDTILAGNGSSLL